MQKFYTVLNVIQNKFEISLRLFGHFEFSRSDTHSPYYIYESFTFLAKKIQIVSKYKNFVVLRNVGKVIA